MSKRGKIKLNLSKLSKENKIELGKPYIKEHINRLYDWSVGDIKRCCRLRADGSFEDGGAPFGAFILWVCAIDFWGGVMTNLAGKKDASQRFKAFVNGYLKDQNKLYKHNEIYDFRNELIHYYTLMHFSVEHDPNFNSKHLQKLNNGSRLLVLGPAISDLETSVTKLITDIKNDDEKTITAFEYFADHLPPKSASSESLNKLII